VRGLTGAARRGSLGAVAVLFRRPVDAVFACLIQ